MIVYVCENSIQFNFSEEVKTKRMGEQEYENKFGVNGLVLKI